MVSSAFSAPHVSLFVDVDATRTMEFVKRLKNSPDFAGVKVSPLLIMAKAIIWAVRRNPTVNSSWTDEEIIIRHYVNLGIAAATPRGLIVPNVKDAQDMSLLELAGALEQLTLTARDGKTSPAEMANGTDHHHEHRRLRHGHRNADPQPGRGRHRRARHDQAEAVGRRRRGASALRHDARRLVRSPDRRRRCRDRASWPTSRASSRSPRCCSTDMSALPLGCPAGLSGRGTRPQRRTWPESRVPRWRSRVRRRERPAAR